MWEILIWLSIFIIGFLIIFFSADVFIDNLKDLCIIYKVSPFIIGLIVLGIDPEESIASIIAAINGLPYIAVGNVIGNSIIALTLCFAIPALYYEVKLKIVSQFYFWLIYSCSIAILFGVLIPFGLFYSGIILLFLYAIYLFRNFKHFSKEKILDQRAEINFLKDNEEVFNESEKTSKIKIFILVIISFILIFIGGVMLISAADELIQLTGISEAFFGFIIIGFITNVEELTLIIKSLKKNIIEIGLGGMIGKLIWNLTITFGISGIIAMNIIFSWNLIWNWILFSTVIIYFNLKARTGFLKRKDGMILAFLFILFIFINFI